MSRGYGYRLRALLFITCACASTHSFAQSNSLALPTTTGKTGDELTLALSGSFQDDVTGMEISVLFDPLVVRLVDVSTTQATSGFSIQTRVADGILRAALAATDPISGPNDLLDLTFRLVGAPGSTSRLDFISVVL